jgi:hypothetical protein
MTPAMTCADAYVAAVARQLTVPAASRRAALDDLRGTLADLARGSSEADAVAALGPASDYATALNEGTDGLQQPRLFGLPNSFGPGIARRIAATFDPADANLVIPRVFGGGWTLNAGAIAARLGLLNPDDLDDEIAAEAVEGPGRLAPLVAAVPSVVALALTARAVRRGGVPLPDLIMRAAVPLVSLGLAGLAASPGFEPRERLAMPGVAAMVGSLAVGANLPADASPRRGTSVLVGWGIGMALSFALKVLPLRAAVAARVSRP